MAPNVKDWQALSEKLTPINLKQIEPILGELNDHLTLRTYLEGHLPTDADNVIWKAIRANRVAHSYMKQNLMINLCRWFRFIEETVKPNEESDAAERLAAANAVKTPAVHEGGSYEIGLQDTERGVVTRFPPEPSGYLHVGHAKAAFLNDFFAHKRYQGRMILRFDDTNPLKEKQEFEDSIIHDLELMGVVPDSVSHTSDFFQQLYELAIKMIELGHAYADDTPSEQLRDERFEMKESKHRNNSVEDNLARFAEMKEGTQAGRKWFIRAKIDMHDKNGAMRDPVIYRCPKDAPPHHRTGDKWNIYPSYDFACPVVDSLEGVTHALRTTEYNDRDAQYQWMLAALKLRHVYNWNFSRLSFTKTFLSKRKLAAVVESGRVWGWDDPRFPTVRGIRRRGMTIPALQEFILKQGPSKSIVLMDWTLIWATNKKYIDPVAGRYTAIEKENIVTCNVYGEGISPDGKPIHEIKDLHLKNKDVGTKTVVTSNTLLIDQLDAQSFEKDEEITLMNWGNAFVRGIHYGSSTTQDGVKIVEKLDIELNLQGDFKLTKKKITWLSKDQELIPVVLYDFDYLLSKDKLEEDDVLEDVLNKVTETKTVCLADCNVRGLEEDDIMQFDRRGYFRCDKGFNVRGGSRIGGIDGKVEEEIGESAVFFQIPTGKKEGPKR